MQRLNACFAVVLYVTCASQAAGDVVVRLGQPLGHLVSEPLRMFVADAVSGRLEERVDLVPSDPVAVPFLIAALENGEIDVARLQNLEALGDSLWGIAQTQNEPVDIWVLSPRLDPSIARAFRAVLSQDLPYFYDASPDRRLQEVGLHLRDFD